MASNQLTIEMARREVMRLLGVKGGVKAHEAYDIQSTWLLWRFDIGEKLVGIKVDPDDLSLSLDSFALKYLAGVAAAFRGTNG